MPGFLSPAAAFSGSLEDYMRHREDLAQQQFQNQMAQRKMDLDQKRAEAELENQLAMRREARERLDDMERNRVEKILGTMEPGDILPPDVIEKAKTLGIPIRMQPPAPQAPIQPAAPEGIAAPEQPAGDQGGTVNQGLPPQPTPAVAPPQPAIRFGGSFAQRQQQDRDARVKALMEQIANLDPESPEYRQALMQYEMTTGKPVPAAALRGSQSNMAPVMTREQALKAGQVPANAKIIEPVDTSARDAAAAARTQAHLDQVHQQAVTELNDRAKPINAQLQAIEDLGTSLNQKTPEADRLIAPQVLKATVSGTGSGFRMTRPEIEAVVGGRSKWETLQATLNQWSTDPKQALIITDEQRQELRSLAKAIRDKAKQKTRKIIDIRHQIDDADSPKTINHLRTQLMEELDKDGGGGNNPPPGVDLVYDPATRTFKKPGGQ